MGKARVVIDIGHGSDTFPEGRGKGIRFPDGRTFAEHDFNSRVGKALKILLEEQNIEVLLTQDPFETDVRLTDRISFVNTEHRKSPIACLVSIHANASNNASANGFGVFHWTTSSLGKELAENWDREARSLFPLKPWGNGIWVSETGSWSNFGILRSTLPPAILTESFFFTNREELEKCDTPEFTELATQAHFNAIMQFLDKYHADREKPKEEIIVPSVPSPQENFILKVPSHGNNYILNGKPVVGGPSVLVVNNSIQVPCRFLAELYNAAVTWNGKTKKIKIVKDGISLVFFLPRTYFYKNGKIIPLESRLIVKEGVTYIPLRIFSEALEFQVEWDAKSRMAVISK